MAQHDYVLDNASGATFRADLNDALAAVVSANSGATAPGTTFAYQLWADTSTGLLKQRNAANTAWITVGTLASTNWGLIPTTEIGSSVQAYDANLTALAGLSPAEGQSPVWSSGSWGLGSAMSADQTARDMAAVALAMADANGVSGTKGPFYLADPFTSDSLTTHTNADYSATGDKYTPTISGYGSDILTSGTVTVDSSTIGSAANTVDDDTGTEWASNIGSNGWVKYDLGSGVSKEPRKLRIYPANYIGDSRIKDFKLQGSNTGAFGGEETEIYSGSCSNTISAWQEFTFSAAGSFRYFRLYIQTAWSGNPGINEWELLESSGFGNPIYVESGTLDTADPTDLMAYFRFVDNGGTLAPASDIAGTLSIDGGTTEAAGSWTYIGPGGAGGEEIWRLDADVSAQTGTSLRYELTGANNKDWDYAQCIGVVPIY